VDANQLFVRTLRDLERRSVSTDEYEVLMSAGLLRKLLLDGGRLVDQVNRHYRLKVRFRIPEVSPFEKMLWNSKPMFWVIADALDPELMLLPGTTPYDATVDQLLARRVMCLHENWVTVRDVIDQLANIEGAVHKGEPKDEREKVIRAAGEMYTRDGLPGLVSLVKTIGQVTVRGLIPLRDTVVATGADT
jgi:hypothetical protein